MITTYRALEDGIWLTFDKPICPNGGVKSNEWFFSWDKLASFIPESRSGEAQK